MLIEDEYRPCCVARSCLGGETWPRGQDTPHRVSPSVPSPPLIGYASVKFWIGSSKAAPKQQTCQISLKRNNHWRAAHVYYTLPSPEQPMSTTPSHHQKLYLKKKLGYYVNHKLHEPRLLLFLISKTRLLYSSQQYNCGNAWRIME